MGKDSDNVFNKIFVGVAIAVISAIIISNLNLNNNQPSPTPSTGTTAQPPNVQTGNWCCDVWGYKRCQLVQPIQVGGSCFCPGQGSGVVCQ